MKLAVMLSTYNGEKYLSEQIDSILNQRLPENMKLKLYIRDDGSGDGTKKLIDHCFSEFQNVVPVNRGGAKHWLLEKFYDFAS